MEVNDGVPQLLVLENAYLCFRPPSQVSPPLVPAIALHSIPTWICKCKAFCFSRTPGAQNAPLSIDNQRFKTGSRKRQLSKSCDCEYVKDVSSCPSILYLPNPFLRDETRAEPLRSVQQTNLIVTTPNGHMNVRQPQGTTNYDIIFEQVRPSRDITHLQICNAVGYWVTDYCDLGGFSQILFLPRLVYEDIGKKDCHDVNYRQIHLEHLNWTSVLQEVLRRCVLTDGMEVWSCCLQSKSAINEFDASPDSSSQIPIHSFCLETINLMTFLDNMHSVEVEAKRVDIKPTMYNPEPPSSWRYSIAAALEARIRSKVLHDRSEEENRRRREHACSRGKLALRELSRCLDNTPVVLSRLRYRTQPTTTMSSKRMGSSLVVYAEIDLWWREDTGKVALQVMYDVHMTCSLEMDSWTDADVMTQSGMTPTLRPGESVTIAMIVDVSGIPTDETNDFVAKSGLILGVQIQWTHGPEPHAHNGDFSALLRLPPDVLVVPQPKMQEAMIAGRKSKDQVKMHPPSTLFFDCRIPRHVLVDVAKCSFSLSDWLGRLTETLEGTLHCIVGQFTSQSNAAVSLILLAYPSWEYLGE